MTKLNLISLCVAALAAPGASAAVVVVDAALLANPTGILAIAGQTYSITATGTADLAAFDGPYVTDPDGTITTAPPPSANAYFFFRDSTLPYGVAPAVGDKKLVPPGWPAQMPGAAYGALAVGFSPLAAPTGLGDFTQFLLAGTSASIVVPPGGGYMFLSVNDINNTADNSGGYWANVALVPEPQTWSLASAFGLGLAVMVRRLRAR